MPLLQVLRLLSSCSSEVAASLLLVVILRWEPEAAVEAVQRSCFNKLGSRSVEGDSGAPNLLVPARHGGVEGSGEGGGGSSRSTLQQGRSSASCGRYLTLAKASSVYLMAEWRLLPPLASVTVVSGRCEQIINNLHLRRPFAVNAVGSPLTVPSGLVPGDGAGDCAEASFHGGEGAGLDCILYFLAEAFGVNLAMDGNLMGCGDAHELKDPLNTTDARNMLGGCGDPPAVEWINADTRVVINPLLLVSACFGSWKALNFLLDREDAQKPAMVMQTQEFFHLLTSDGTTNTQAFENDVEEGVDQLAFPAADAPLLNGVTVEGDTALHAVASHGDDTNYLKCANIIHDRAKHLLFVLNGNGDTPLHCAARAGKSKMVLRLISQVTNEDARHQLLRKENGRKETALHEAVRIGDNGIVDLLMTADLQLANYPSESISPLYLAILLEKYTIAMTLYETSKGNLSYSGPNGQNALHAAVHRSKGMTEKLLVWNKSLTTQADTNGSTPLHFASDQLAQSKISVQQQVLTISLFPWFRRIYSSQIVDKIFKANLAPLYQPDKCGLYPIHIAASIGAESTIAAFTERCPSSASLRDARGRTFLHVAVEKKMNNVVLFACQNSSLEWILNLQDNEGNTALHLAVQAKSLGLFCSLFGNPRTLLNLTNNNGQTPFDVTRNGSTSSYLFDGDIGIMLRSVGAKRGVCRSDHYKEKYGIDPKNKLKQSESLKNSAESQGIVTVLIATMTFGATFALPGGYRADDHTNGGTPTLAGRYVFSAFLMANTLAFVCSSIATLGIMYAGNTRNKMSFRRAHFLASSFFAHGSVTSLSVAFALGVYSVLAPVAPKTANAICIISSLVVLYNEAGGLRRLVLLTNSLCKRVGFITAMRDIIPAAIGGILRGFWQFIVIFIWLAYVSKSQQH